MLWLAEIMWKRLNAASVSDQLLAPRESARKRFLFGVEIEGEATQRDRRVSGENCRLAIVQRLTRSSHRGAAVIWGRRGVVGGSGGRKWNVRLYFGVQSSARGNSFPCSKGAASNGKRPSLGQSSLSLLAAWLAFPRHVTVRRSAAAAKEEEGEESETRRRGGGSSAVWPLPKRPAATDVRAALREAESGGARTSQEHEPCVGVQLRLLLTPAQPPPATLARLF